MDDSDAILYSGPHTIGNKPIITKGWTPDFNFKDEILKTIPLWVTLPNLPLNCWSADSLSRIGSGLGVPLYTDESTSKMERISYARILVEMDVTVSLPVAVKVQDPNGRKFSQRVDYMWKPEYCETCFMIGHCCKVTRQQENSKTVRINVQKKV
ncbi:uncharacterized protein LOC142168005 [Nicotiana tabacum]|uniref:Uncharacterized protein LOC142168005 n=1 Tax=Nicotiana tabacum TaxID=4097 RepID=A0AC58SIE9_TOBAC